MEDRNEILKSRIISKEEYMDDGRAPYLHDRDRIIFSRAFRRLAFKTQVVPASGRDISDHIRTRLTHSLEVMQIASSIALEVKSDKNRKLDIDLIQAISLGHDIGHTAYGHIGERVLSKFIFGDGTSGDKVKHTFQSLKMCCFLEKQYKPDFYGLNLTIATLDGILKHSYLDYEKRSLYKEIFNSYEKIFWDEPHPSTGVPKIDPRNREKLHEYLFEYVSPLTYEGIIVAIADEIAQLCHDIEDIRRLGGLESVIDFYEEVRKQWDEVEENLPKHTNVKKVYDDFVDVFEAVKDRTGEVAKLERLYVKLIISICIPIVSKVIKTLQDMRGDSRNNLLKEKYLGEFKDIKKLKLELKLNKDEIKLIKYLEKISNYYEKEVLMKLPTVAKWDIKGEELYEELSEKLCKVFNYNTTEINLNIIKSNIREDLKNSYYAGKEFEKSQKTRMVGVDDLPIKFAIWDHLASMTDNYIIEEYESLTFKHVEIR